MAKKEKAKKIGDGIFETKETIDTFGPSAEMEGGGTVQELSTQATTPLIDDATGQKLVLRCFEFALPPGKKWHNKQEILTAHERFIMEFCWKDGLVVNTEVPPRVVLSKKENKARIFALCEAKLGATIMEVPLTLQQITKPNNESRGHSNTV